MINVFQPMLGLEEVQAVERVIKSNWIGKGPMVRELQTVWASDLGVPTNHVIATTCATEGLFQIAELILGGCKKACEVIMPTVHFIGAANAVLSTGAKLVFCDVDEHTLVPTWNMIKAKISRKTQAVFIMHYGGMTMPDYPLIVSECKKRHIILVEDCATAPTATLAGFRVGTGGDYAVWSFDAMKIASGGDGGLIYSADPVGAIKLHERVNLGLTVESGLSSNERKWWTFDTTGPYRRATMNDITAAIILEQVKKLPGFVQTRERLYNLYSLLLSDTPDIILPPEQLGGSYYTYWIQTASRDGLAEYLKSNGIYTTFRYYPLHNIYGGNQAFPGATRAAATTLNLPLHQAMTEKDVTIICGHIDTFMRK